jgi:shikimate dehydrogenase
VLGPVLAGTPATLVIANRTVQRAEHLAAAYADLGPVSGGGFEALAGRTFDLVINATAASLLGAALPLPETLGMTGSIAYDLMYADAPTPFMRWALRHGALAAHDGLGMLVEQAAESFLLWRGVRPRTAPVIATLRGA